MVCFPKNIDKSIQFFRVFLNKRLACKLYWPIIKIFLKFIYNLQVFEIFPFQFVCMFVIRKKSFLFKSFHRD